MAFNIEETNRQIIIQNMKIKGLMYINSIYEKNITDMIQQQLHNYCGHMIEASFINELMNKLFFLDLNLKIIYL